MAQWDANAQQAKCNNRLNWSVRLIGSTN
jgi:hypothetical protein